MPDDPSTTVEPNADPKPKADPKPPEPQPTPEWEKRLADKDRHIARLEAERRQDRAEIDQIKKRLPPPPQPPKPRDPNYDRFEKSLENVEGSELYGSIEDLATRVAEKRFKEMAPQIFAAIEAKQNADRGFEGLKTAGIEDDPKDLKLHEHLARMSPLGALAGKYLDEAGPEKAREFIDGILKRKATEKMKADVLDFLATGEGPGKERIMRYMHAAEKGDPNAKGYLSEDEYPIFQYELSKAPHARRVEDLDRWRDGIEIGAP